MGLPRSSLNFGQALEWLQGGIPMRRAGWNAPHLILLQRPDEHSKMTQSYIYMNTVQGDNIPWVASQSDLLASYWEVVGTEANPK